MSSLWRCRSTSSKYIWLSAEEENENENENEQVIVSSGGDSQ